MIKIKKLVKYWKSCEYNNEDVINEYNRLVNAIWTLYENGMIDSCERDIEFGKLNTALLEFEKFYNYLESRGYYDDVKID